MKKIRYLTSVFITLCVVFLFYIKRFIILKYYPPVCNFVIFLIFFFSIFGEETIIQKFAKACGDELKEATIKYTRVVTYIWCIFAFINFLISILTIFLSDKIWILYNGCISYILVGLLFGIEYTIRVILQKREII